jgi:diacylglycerol kinase family enzyme
VIIALLVARDPLSTAVVLVAAVGAAAFVRGAIVSRVALPAVDSSRRPALIFNPHSGGGKATRLRLADEARRRGIDAVEMSRDVPLETIVEGLLAQGADALAVAGGDGSQAQVAAIAAREGIPYACIPAGTRNHFALDLGVDRDDVVGALDAFVSGVERTVDLAEVNGQVFVNNVSLGIYADAVQRPGYRAAKLRTLTAAVPDSLGPDAEPPTLSWDGPGGRESGVAILVSNNSYRLGRAIGSGTRPRLDRGELGIAVLGPGRLRDHAGKPGHSMKQWSTRRLVIDSPEAVPAGIDGEATTLQPPLHFRPIAGALRVRIAQSHPGASPSAIEPDSPWDAVGMLIRFAFSASDHGATAIASP